MEEELKVEELRPDELSQEMEVEDTKCLTIQVTTEQESAMEAFFQINSWQLIKEKREMATTPDNSSLCILTVRLTSEQEAAIEAFFQINNWSLVRVETGLSNLSKILHDIHSSQNEDPSAEQILISDGTTVEEVQGLQEVQVTAPGADGNPQIITVYTEGGNAHGIPQSLLNDSGDGDKKIIPQVIIQEITLPDGMTLDQGLVIANASMNPPTVKTVTPRGTTKPGDKIYKCHVCNKTFKQAQSFHGHYQSHFGAKPYQCDICQTGFTLKAALVAHQSIHTGAKPFTCALCNKGFRRKDDMMSHIRTHTGEKPYECDICGKKFKYRNQIPKHRRAHTGDKPYKCGACPKSFTSNIHLRRHERTHTGERPYVCKVCSKAFTQCGHLQAHMRIHTDERPFTCSYCGRGFREKKVMKKHEALHSADRPYKCKICEKGFLRQSNLELHSVMHQKQRDGALLVRPRPKAKKKPDAEMRDFVANVLMNVKKVDSSIQTDTYVNGIPHTDDNVTDSNNLTNLVNYTVSQESNSDIKVEPVSTLQNINGEEQYTLVMQDDGNEGYLITGYDQGNVGEQIVSMPAQQVEISSGYTAGTTHSGLTVEAVTYEGSEEDITIKALEKAVTSDNVVISTAETESNVQLDTALGQPMDNVVMNSLVSIQHHDYDVDRSGELGATVSSEGKIASDGHTDTTLTDLS